MSLLLDALKKAADDKQKASNGNSAEPLSVQETQSEQVAAAGGNAEDTSSNIETPAQENNAPVLPANGAASSEELTLDPIENNVTAVSDNTRAESREDVAVKNNTDDIADESAPVKNTAATEAATTSYTVSDEALSMLIYKTNRDAKQSKRLLQVSVILLSLGILISGGVYYYMDMQEEIATLERKHRIATMSMQSKTSTDAAPEQSKIIRNLVSESDLNDKVQFAKKQIAKEKKTQQVQRRPAATVKNNTGTAASVVSFRKTKTTDPVEEKLEQAWLAYEAARYDSAKKLYKAVLLIEKNNRDALLGLGAIAVIEKNNPAARNIYMALLKQDPRDPIAISALASLRDNNVGTEQDEKYLSNMLLANPEDAHLNFALGNVYAQQGKWKPAQQSYFNAWQRDIENADYIFNMAVSMDQLGKQAQALRFYQDCLNKSKGRQVSFSREAVQQRIADLSGV